MKQAGKTSMSRHSMGMRPVGVALILAALSTGCSGEAGDSSLEVRSRTEALTLDTTSQFSLVIPSQVAVGSSAVFASSSVKWGDRASMIASGSSGVISSGDNGNIEVGHDANVRTVVSAGSATVRDRAKVDGDLFVQGSAQIGSSAQVFGNRALGVSVPTQEAFVMPVYLPDEVGGNVNLEPDQQRTLPPADYGTVSVKSRSTVTLTTGTYEFDTLQVAEPQAKLLIDDSAGPVIIYVRNQFTFRGNVQVQSTTGGFPDLLVVYLGQSDLWLEAPFQGHLFAPHAFSHIRPMQGVFTGSVWGKNVEIHPQTVFIHQPFDLATFFLNIKVDNTPYIFGQSRPVVLEPTDFIIPSRVPSGNWTPLPGGKPAELNCTPELTYEVDPEDPTRVLGVRYLTEEEIDENSGCVGEYLECEDNGDGTFGSPVRPSEEELNGEPAAGSTCEAVTQKAPCGVDDSVLDLPVSQRTTCAVQADCASGEVCAKYCLGEDCQPDEFVHYCTREIESCGGLPEQTQCETRSVCPEPDYTGGDYVVNDDEDVTELSAEQELSEAEPVLAAYERPACESEVIPPGGSHDDSSPPQGSGNDKWGIDFTPVVDYGFSTPSTASPITEELGVNGRAEFNVVAKVWGKQVPVLEAGVVGSLSPTSLELSRTSKLFGQDVDLTGDVVGQIKDQMNDAVATGVATQLALVEGNLKDAQQAFSNLVWIRDVIASNDILGNPEAGEDFCNLALTVLPGAFPTDPVEGYCSPEIRCDMVICEDEPCEGDDGDPTTCDYPLETAEEAAQRFAQAVQTSLDAWKDEYQEEINALGNPETALQNAIAPALNELPGANPALATNVPLESARHRFSAFRFSFTFPVGPIPVTMEIELAGSWGVDAVVELSADFEDELYARAGASVIPGMDVQALAFAGINLGFASAGIGGELTLVDIEIPVKGGAEIRGQRINDDRPLQLAVPGGIQDVSDLSEDMIPLLTTKWSGGFWYGAGMRVTVLAGNVNLQARVQFLFFTKTWKQVLASWKGIEFEKSFVGSIQAAATLELPAELEEILGEVAAAGEALEDIPALLPLWDKGYTGHFGTQTPLLSQVAAQQLEWPPAFGSGAGFMPIPTPEQLCVEPEEVPR